VHNEYPKNPLYDLHEKALDVSAPPPLRGAILSNSICHG